MLTFFTDDWFALSITGKWIFSSSVRISIDDDDDGSDIGTVDDTLSVICDSFDALKSFRGGILSITDDECMHREKVKIQVKREKGELVVETIDINGFVDVA